MRLFELTASGNVAFRIAVCVPMAVRMYHSLCYRNLFAYDIPKRDGGIYRLLVDLLFPLHTIEVLSIALLSIVTLRFDYPGMHIHRELRLFTVFIDIHRKALYMFLITTIVYMQLLTALGFKFIANTSNNVCIRWLDLI